eukprot:jgi/Mesvir1/11717/Mv00101-RA.1
MANYGAIAPTGLPTAHGPSESAPPQEKIHFYEDRIKELSSQKDAHKQALSLLGQAESHLKGAMEDLSKAMTAAKVDVLGDFGPRRRGVGLFGGGLVDRASGMAESARLHSAKQHTAQASQAMQQALRLSPQMPLTPEARLPGGAGGFMNFMIDGVMMDAMMIKRITESKHQVEMSLRSVATAQQWEDGMVREISSSRDHAQAKLGSIQAALAVQQATAQAQVAPVAPVAQAHSASATSAQFVPFAAPPAGMGDPKCPPSTGQLKTGLPASETNAMERSSSGKRKASQLLVRKHCPMCNAPVRPENFVEGVQCCQRCLVKACEDASDDSANDIIEVKAPTQTTEAPKWIPDESKGSRQILEAVSAAIQGPEAKAPEEVTVLKQMPEKAKAPQPMPEKAKAPQQMSEESKAPHLRRRVHCIVCKAPVPPDKFDKDRRCCGCCLKSGRSHAHNKSLSAHKRVLENIAKVSAGDEPVSAGVEGKAASGSKATSGDKALSDNAKAAALADEGLLQGGLLHHKVSELHKWEPMRGNDYLISKTLTECVICGQCLSDVYSVVAEDGDHYHVSGLCADCVCEFLGKAMTARTPVGRRRQLRCPICHKGEDWEEQWGEDWREGEGGKAPVYLEAPYFELDRHKTLQLVALLGDEFGSLSE